VRSASESARSRIGFLPGFFQDKQSFALAIRSGDIDLAFPTDPVAFAATSGTKVISAPGCQPAFLTFKTDVAPQDEVHVWRAVAGALNRAAIVKAVGPQATPATTVIAPGSLDSLASKAQVEALIRSLPNTQFRLAKARQELAMSH
jgi:ABC-type transport system substrate-binding protein